MSHTNQPGLIKSVGVCLNTGVSAVTSIFKSVDNLAKTAEAHSELYMTTALNELSQANLPELDNK